MKTIRGGLIAQHPDKKAVFTTNAEKYLKKLQALDKEYTEAFSQAKQKSFVTQHSAFAYLALDYGLTQVPISGVSAESDPSAKRIASLSKYVSEYDIKYIYFEENASSSIAKTLANEVGVKTAVLNPIESLTTDQLKKGEDYVSVMTENLKSLRFGQQILKVKIFNLKMEAMTRKLFKMVTLMTKMLKTENCQIGQVSGNRFIPSFKMEH